MNKLQKLSATLFAILLTFSACTKSLELEPISEISNSSFWKTENDATAALNGMYARLRIPAASNFYMWGEARSEIMGPSLAGTAGLEIYYQNILDKRNISSTQVVSNNTWLSLYAIVHDANLILKNVPGIQFTSEAAKKSILAQAYTMRAFIYFQMTKIWGDVVLVTEPSNDLSPETIHKERSPKSEVMAFIKKDINDAVSLFENNKFSTGRNRWSKPAALALKADVYLWSGKRMNAGNADIQTALEALNEIENSDVALLDNFSSVFEYNNKGNKEIVMSVNFKDGESGGTSFGFMYMHSLFMPTNIDQETKNAIGAFGGAPYWAPTALVRNQFTQDDQRKKASFLEIYTYDNQNNKTYFGSLGYKFKGVEIGGQRQFLDDVVLYRYADILLMKAEAKNVLGQDPSIEINKVRKRAYQNNFSAHIFANGNKVQNDEAILKERLLELIFEGKRWWDLIRFDKAFDIVPSLISRKGQDYLLLFPIAESTLSLEPKVKQNPGFN